MNREARQRKKREKRATKVASRPRVKKIAQPPQITFTHMSFDKNLQISDDEVTFWRCHGANYLASDSTTGVWDPLFESIYSGSLPSPDSINRVILNRYVKEMRDETFDGVPRAVLSWAVTDARIISIFKHEAVRRMKEKHPDILDAEVQCQQPHNPVVWSLMDEVKVRSLIAGMKMDEERTLVEKP